MDIDAKKSALGPLAEHVIDKELVRRWVDETNERMGFVPDPAANIDELREMMRGQGIRPDDNILSSGIIAARYGIEDE